MWVQSWVPNITDLPLFDPEKNPSLLIGTQSSAIDYSPLPWVACSDCWTHVSLEGICPYCTTLKEVKDVFEIIPESQPKVFNPPRDLKNQYIDNEQLSWSVKVLKIEFYEGFNIAVIEISHKYPWHEYIHKWNKRNPETGVYDGEQVQIKKISTGTTEKKYYRVQYSPRHIDNTGYPIFYFGGKKRDGKECNLNTGVMVEVLKEIESLA